MYEVFYFLFGEENYYNFESYVFAGKVGKSEKGKRFFFYMEIVNV
jgi:hypothetical protein